MGRIAKLAWLVREILAGDCTRRQENAWKEAAGKAEERLKKIEMGQYYRAAVPRMWGAPDAWHPLGITRQMFGC